MADTPTPTLDIEGLIRREQRRLDRWRFGHALLAIVREGKTDHQRRVRLAALASVFSDKIPDKNRKPCELLAKELGMKKSGFSMARSRMSKRITALMDVN